MNTLMDSPQESPPSPAHFKGKDAINHVIEAQVQGKLAAAEIHGTEMPGHLSAGCDAARETAIALLLVWTLLLTIHRPLVEIIFLISLFSWGWILWKSGRSAWLGWSRLERLHRILKQEQWEIEHHRQQEKEELKVLYSAKGFEGKLLDDVVDVLMADNDRLLKVMVEEELGLTLESHEHPLKESLGAGIGSAITYGVCLFGLWLFPFGLLAGAFLVIAIAASISAYHQQNRYIPAIVWNVALAGLSFGCIFFLTKFFFPHMVHP